MSMSPKQDCSQISDDTCDLLVTGTGRLSRAVCYSLAAVREVACNVLVAGRDASRVAELIAIARGRAVAFDSHFSFSGTTLTWDDANMLEDLLASTRPRVVFHTASLQSPWALCDCTSSWSGLVRRVGFGITLPLQAVLAVRLATALRNASPNSILVNACYPDAVNAVIVGCGLSVLCGIGNIDILATSIRSNLPRASRAEYKVIGHHFNVAAISAGDFSHLPLLFLADHNQVLAEDTWRLVRSLACIHGPELNHLTGAAAVTLLITLLTSGVADLHLPGPAGRLGGYPMRLSRGSLSFALPGTLSMASAERFNEAAAERDGVVISTRGEVVFTNYSPGKCSTTSNTIPVRWYVQELEQILEVLLALRDDLPVVN